MAMVLRLLLLASVSNLVVAALDVKSVDEVPSRRLQQGLSLPERFVQRYTISQDQILALSPQCVSYLNCIMQVPVSLALLGMAASRPATGQDPLAWLCNEGQSFLGMRPDIAQSCAVVIPATTTTLTTTTTTSEKITATTDGTTPTTTISVAITNDTETTGASDVTRRLQQIPMLPQWFVQSYNIGQDRLLALPPQCISNLQCNMQTTLSVALLGWASAWPGASQDPLDWLCNEAEFFLRKYTAIAQACPTWTTTTTTVYVPPTSPPAAMPYYPWYVPYAAPAPMPYYPWYVPAARAATAAAATNPAVILDPTIVMDPTVVIRTDPGTPGGPGGPGPIMSPGTLGAPGGWGSSGSSGRPWTPTESRPWQLWTPTRSPGGLESPRTPVSSGRFGRPSSPGTRPSGTGSYGGKKRGHSSGGRFR